MEAENNESLILSVSKAQRIAGWVTTSNYLHEIICVPFVFQPNLKFFFISIFLYSNLPPWKKGVVHYSKTYFDG